MKTAETLYAVQHIRRMRGGSQAHLIRASDSNLYITKFQNNPQHIRVLASEYLGSKVGASLGLPMPEVKIIDVFEDLISHTPELRIETAVTSQPCASGLQLASRYITSSDGVTFDHLPKTMLERIANRKDFHHVLAFDKWTGNSDGRQAVFVKQSENRKYHATFIDQGYCFNAGEWSFPDLPLLGVYSSNDVYQGVTGWTSFEPVLSQIKEVELSDLWTIAHEIPEEWYQGDTEGLFRLIDTLHNRRSLIPDLITRFRISSRNPFPNWIGA